ncbi:MAG: cytidylate kinase-like family protein [Treponema sp.]|uniref:cytidylate kinase-like family protein n=1 Tax=Treponema sp. TaxID=166 RepID=UPI001DB019E2|nr:cytidylate kinase-like family protein [Treponema sp.]MBS7310052.1 cytidylate kinase-like family protein [Treponema sp.]
MAIITISRQVAALGDEIACEVAEKLGYKFVGRKEIEKRIVDMGFPASKLEKYDERKPGFFASLAKDRDEYMDYLATAIIEAASEGNTVLIGRGSGIILQELPNLVSFRFVAKDEVRIERLKKEFDWNDKQAKQRIDESHTNRLGFHKSFFNRENDDATDYHLVMNTGILTVDQASDIIVQTVKSLESEEKEAAGKIKVKNLLTAQNLVNTLVFKYKININFLHAVVDENTVTLQGVADSSAIVEKAVVLAQKELSDYKIQSTISVVQDFKAYP